MSIHPKAHSFASAAQAYQAGRPDYPQALLEALPVAGVRDAIDVGAGTGKFTRLLRQVLPTDARLLALEPVSEMAVHLSALNGVQVVQRSIYDSGLADFSADLVTCAQAFHWFADEQAVGELARILRPGGTLALLWNTRDDRVPWVKAYTDMIDAHLGDSPNQLSGRWRWVLEDPRFELDSPVEVDYQHQTDREAVYQRVLSTSYIAALPESEKADLLPQTLAILDAAGLGERFAMPYVSTLFRLKKK